MYINHKQPCLAIDLPALGLAPYMRKTLAMSVSANYAPTALLLPTPIYICLPRILDVVPFHLPS